MTETYKKPNPADLDLGSLLSALWRGKWKILLSVAACLALSWALLSATLSQKYEATVVLDITSTSVRAIGGQPTIIEGFASSEELFKEREIITGFEMLSSLIAELDLQNDPEFDPNRTTGFLNFLWRKPSLEGPELDMEIVKLVRSKLNVNTPDKSKLIEITVQSSKPQKAAKIANTLALQYTQIHAQDFLAQAMIALPNLADPKAGEVLAQALLQEAKNRAEALSLPNLQAPVSESMENLAELRDVSERLMAVYGLALSATHTLDFAAALPRVPLQFRKLFAEITLPARAPTEKLSTDLTICMALAAVIGFGAACALILARAFTEHRIHTADDLREYFSTRIWGSVPSKAKSPDSTRELYRGLRSAIMLENEEAPPQVILMTSAEPGKTMETQALELARSYQALGKSALVIDADLRASALSQTHAPNGQGGLANLLRGTSKSEDAITLINDVAVILGARNANDAVEALSTDAVGEVLHELRSRFDVIIVASGAASEVSDAAVLQPYIDCVVVGVYQGETRRGQIDEAFSRLYSPNARDTGFCLIT